MGGPTEGKYCILPVHGPKLFAGVDHLAGPTVPVVLGGQDRKSVV